MNENISELKIAKAACAGRAVQNWQNIPSYRGKTMLSQQHFQPIIGIRLLSCCQSLSRTHPAEIFDIVNKIKFRIMQS
jgi:hypothetical protein